MPGQPIGRLEAVALDVADLALGEAFWSVLLGVDFGPSTQPQYRAAHLPSGLLFLLQLVPESKVVKNRMHVDFEVADLDAAFAKVEAAGGTFVRQVDDPGYSPFYVCADPDGNECCLTLP